MTHKFASYVFIAVGALGLSTVPALATSVCPDDVSLTTYLASGYSCEVGDLVFSNFTYTASGTNQVAASSVTVDTLGSLTGTDPASISSPSTGLEFNAPWTAGSSGASSDATIGFTVSEVNGGPMTIEDFGLAQTSGVVGAGSSAGVIEDGCAGPSPCTPIPLAAITFDEGGSNTQRVDDVMFSPTGSVQVTKDISVNAGPGSPVYADLSQVADTFSEVPEPRSLALVLGLAIAGLLLRKKYQGEAA